MINLSELLLYPISYEKSRKIFRHRETSFGTIFRAPKVIENPVYVNLILCTASIASIYMEP